MKSFKWLFLCEKIIECYNTYSILIRLQALGTPVIQTGALTISRQDLALVVDSSALQIVTSKRE